MKESSKERFARLASKRTNAVLEKLRVLGNCSNKSMYSYTEADIKKIFNVIEQEVKETKTRFKTKYSRKFTL